MGGSREGAALRGAEVSSWSSERSWADVKARSFVLCAVVIKTRLPKQTRLTALLFSPPPRIWGKFPRERDGEGSVCENGMRCGDGLVIVPTPSLRQ